MECRICEHPTRLFFKGYYDFYQCLSCKSVQRHPSTYPSLQEEKKRYEQHNNDVNDLNYQQFVKPIVNEVLKNHQPNEKGLDFGSGTGPVITKLLKDKDYYIQTYDPIFDNNKAVLQQQYHFIVCCEVMEHFHDPKKEFTLLKSLLLPGGKLYCMTDLYSVNIDFDKWYYKNDPTHVFFYSKKSLEYIKRKWGFSKLKIASRLITFSKQ